MTHPSIRFAALLAASVACTLTVLACGPLSEEQYADNDPDRPEACAADAQDTLLCDCGATLTRTCEAGAWDRSCADACPTATNNGATNNGASNNGALNNGATNNGATNNAPPPTRCDDGSFEEQACGTCGVRTRACRGGQWSAWGTCEDTATCPPDDSCSPGLIASEPCADRCTFRQRSCDRTGQWGTWGACEHFAECETLSCNSGERRTEACGTCGARTSTCTDGAWSDGSSCAEDTCSACTTGESLGRACGTCGHQTATCARDGQWNAFGACEEPEAGCPATCASRAVLARSDSPEDIFVGLALLDADRLALSSLSWSNGTVRLVDLNSGDTVARQDFGDLWNNVMVPAISTPVVDRDRQTVYVAWQSWRAQFGDDGPTASLRALSADGTELWTAPVWSYGADDHYGVDLTPVLLGDEVLVNTGSAWGFSLVEPQLRAFDAATGAMRWSVSTFMSGDIAVQPDLEAVYTHTSALVLRNSPGTDSFQLLHNGLARTSSSGSVISMPLALSADGQTLYAAVRELHIDIQPAQDFVTAVDATSTTPDTFLWSRLLPEDEIIQGPPVLTPELLILPVTTGLLALDRATGEVAWVYEAPPGERLRDPVVGDDGTIYAMGWDAEANTVTLHGLSSQGQAAFVCVASERAAAANDPANHGSSAGGQLSPILLGGRLIVPIADELLTFDVPSEGLAASGWPRRRADAQNSARPR